jgi:sulfur carrier protein
MNLQVNGQIKEFPDALNLKELVDKFSKGTAPLVAELNGEIIKSIAWNTTVLNEGDVVELVTFVGGG